MILPGGNPVVATAPSGDASALIANTAFVTNGVGAAVSALRVRLFDYQFVISGGGNVLTTGNKGWLHVPFACNITAWRLLVNPSGTLTIDILRGNNTFPTASIVGSGTKPNVSGAVLNQAAPSGWTSTALVADDWIAFNVTGTIASVTQATIVLTCAAA